MEIDMKMIEKRAIEQGSLVSINKYYDRDEETDKLMIEDIVVNNLLVFKKNMLEIEGSVPEELYGRLEIRKQLAHIEDEAIRNQTIDDMLQVVSLQERERILGVL